MRIGKYEILSEIARGGMGVVYRARDPYIDRIVALKTLLPETALSEELRRRMIVEARAAGNLRHPNIVTIYDLGQVEGTPFIAMEYLEGMPLNRLIRRHPRTLWQSKLGIILTVAEALDFAHRHNVIHRDIKPANILLLGNGLVKVLDFGIARVSDLSLTATGQVMGTVQYMAPEQLQGLAVDRRCDVFALGAVAYELLGGTRPFEGEPLAQLLYRIVHEPHAPCPRLPDRLACHLGPILDRALAKNRDQRYQSMAEMARALRELLHDRQAELREADEAARAEIDAQLAGARSLLAAGAIAQSATTVRAALAIDPSLAESLGLADRVEEQRQRALIALELQQIEELVASEQLIGARRALRAILRRDTGLEEARQLLETVEERLRLAGHDLSTPGALAELDAISGGAEPGTDALSSPSAEAPRPAPAPRTPAPRTPAPRTPAPRTPAPRTPAPRTPVPLTPAPLTPAPPSPPLPASTPRTPKPLTPAPSTPLPGSSAPTPASALSAPAPSIDSSSDPTYRGVGPAVPESSRRRFPAPVIAGVALASAVATIALLLVLGPPGPRPEPIAASALPAARTPAGAGGVGGATDAGPGPERGLDRTVPGTTAPASLPPDPSPYALAALEPLAPSPATNEPYAAEGGDAHAVVDAGMALQAPAVEPSTLEPGAAEAHAVSPAGTIPAGETGTPDALAADLTAPLPGPAATADVSSAAADVSPAAVAAQSPAPVAPHPSAPVTPRPTGVLPGAAVAAIALPSPPPISTASGVAAPSPRANVAERLPATRLPAPSLKPTLPRDLEALVAQAAGAVEHRDFTSARTSLEQALRRAPHDPRAPAWRSWCQAAVRTEQGDQSLAARDFKGALESYSLALLRLKGVDAFPALADHVRSRAALADGELQLLNQNFQAARVAFERAGDTAEGRAGQRRVRVAELHRDGETALAQNLPDRALAAYTEIIQLEPRDEEAASKLVRIDEMTAGSRAGALSRLRADADAAFERGEYRVACELLEALARKSVGDATLAARLALARRLRDAEPALAAGDCEELHRRLDGLTDRPALDMIAACDRRRR